MIARAHRFGSLVFDRDAVVRAALRAYVENVLAWVDPLSRLAFPVCAGVAWMGNPERGALCNDNGCGDYEVVAWTETGVVGLACVLGFGPIEQLGLAASAVTGGPDDVRAAVPGLPPELEPAFEMAAGMLEVGDTYGEKQAGVGFWLHGGHVAGTLFDDPTAAGADRLAAWGALREGRLPRLCDPETAAVAAELDRTTAAPIQALVDAVTTRALTGPTELTTDELATLLPVPLAPSVLVGAQRWLQKVGVTWPGSPDIPEEPRPSGHPFLPEAR